MILYTEPFIKDKHFVRAIHYKPELLSVSKRAEGIEVSSIPESEHREGFIAELFYNPITKTLFYEYKEAPVESQDEIALLKQKLADLEAKLSSLIATK